MTDDLISRQAAIEAMKDWYDGMIISSFRGIEKVIKALPSAQPTVDAEPVRHGKWMPREEGCVYPFWERYTCSACGKHADNTEYCPHCGARMDEE